MSAAGPAKAVVAQSVSAKGGLKMTLIGGLALAGAVVKLTLAGREMIQPRLSAGSYLCQHDPRLHFGLGPHARIDRLEVRWPDGSRQTMTDVPADRRLVIRHRVAPLDE